MIYNVSLRSSRFRKKLSFCTSKFYCLALFPKFMAITFSDNRDHLLNLYGPTLVHEEGKSGMLLEPVKSIDLIDDDTSTEPSSPRGSFRRSGKRYRISSGGRDHEHSPLTHDSTGLAPPPPPLPPRGHSFKPSTLVNNLSASFRRRNHTLSVDVPSVTAAEDERPSSQSRKELSLVRHAFQSSSHRVCSSDFRLDTFFSCLLMFAAIFSTRCG